MPTTWKNLLNRKGYLIYIILKRIKLFPFLVLLIFSSCNYSPPNVQINKTPEISQPEKVKFDSLISIGANKRDDRIKLGNIYNLDIMFGFRRLKFGTNIDSIDFYSGDYDFTYKTQNIILINSENQNLNVFDSGDKIKLTFYKSKLCQIQISNDKFSDRNKWPPQRYFNTQLNDLTDLYGQPTRKFSSPIPQTDLEKRRARIRKALEKYDIDAGLTRYNTDVSWQSYKVALRFKQYYAIENLEFPPSMTALRHESSSLCYTLLGYENIIQRSMRLVEDSLERVRNQDWNKLREKELKNKF